MTIRNNKHVVVFQDLFTIITAMVHPTFHQKAERTARLLVKEIVPCFGVSEVFVSDRGMNLLSHL